MSDKRDRLELDELMEEALFSNTELSSEDEHEDSSKSLSQSQSNMETGSVDHMNNIDDKNNKDKQNNRIVEQLDATTRQVLRRYSSIREAADTMQFPYTNIYNRCYAYYRHISTPLGLFILI